ncbi:peptide-methionine (S)-S-oxide reductase MsrA [Thiorhodovibrio frisius]|uniref:Peptide methionine sulfoxide reductase MsrA n=1 Tax=Thiorhodovibrio frisius TaxID=631362 RepID=H8Z0Q0_9GAMM|nr:peptide-methionine (S)-S-oxide reductase MsrA [Thiorhodovibrio frisius]EIC22391.1 methionine-R-sulfoxide reductase/methionine-S-sulfoxide reductase [Thiorhodovibrio frisius]WPL24690.1 Peptide methionine sulfoxide reductase MsrA [Thiorhodovibrio frisius]
MTNWTITQNPASRDARALASQVVRVIGSIALGSVLLISGWARAQDGAAAGDTQQIVLGMGCFWGAEKRMSELPGVLEVVSGYAGGERADPSYRQILADERSGEQANHAEVVRVTFDPAQTSLERILAGFWENHDPTQGDRQGNDVGSNYRSAIYFSGPAQEAAARRTKARYQQALNAAGRGTITTEIAPLRTFYPAEEEHQDYLQKHPNGYCGLGGTGVRYPLENGQSAAAAKQEQGAPPLSANDLVAERQLIVFEAEGCAYCALFKKEVLAHWQSPVPVRTTLSALPPSDWTLAEPLWATPTIVLFEEGQESARHTGYSGDAAGFWRWLAQQTLSPEAFEIAYGQATEAPFTGSLLDNHRPGTYVDPVTGVALFRSDAKFTSGTGWPSFFQPLEGAVTMHEDASHGMRRIEVRSASSGIHLGHVFNDGPPPTGKRYCINSGVLRFIPDQPL